MTRATLGAILVAVLAVVLSATTVWRALTAPPALPPNATAEVPTTQRASAEKMPLCVLSHSRRDFETIRPQCQKCETVSATRADVEAGETGECAEIAGGTLNVTSGDDGVNLRCAKLRDVTITSNGPLNGLDLSYANLRDVTLRGDGFNTVMTCADIRLGKWEGAFSNPELGGTYLYNVDLGSARLTNVRAAHAMIAPSFWPADTAGEGADARINFQRPIEAGTLLPLDTTLTLVDGLASLTPGESVEPLTEMARRVDNESKRQIEARIKALQAGLWERLQRMFASSLWHGLGSIGGVWGFLTIVFFGLIILEANREPGEMAITRSGTPAAPWAKPPRAVSGRITTAGLAALKGLWGPVVQVQRRFLPWVPPPPGTQVLLEGLRLKGVAAFYSWIGTSATLAVLSLMGSRAIFGS